MKYKFQDALQNIHFSRKRKQLTENLLLLADTPTSRTNTTCNRRLRIHNIIQLHYDFVVQRNIWLLTLFLLL
jgi:hypothetical protein